jgi:hypothetical protein
VLQVVVFLALAFSIVIAIFAVQNTTPVVRPGTGISGAGRGGHSATGSSA